ncbi:MAG TPA: 50S ribosomal protein L22 [Saprospiraceae bacterium]|nr:50S ribosomal protein L22 [Saprospiraceae bacterium]
MEATAKLNNCPMSARKMRLVVDLIRNENVDNAFNILKYNKKEASVWLEKLLLSAISNWEYKNDLVFDADDYDLFVKEIFVNEGTPLKRFRPRAQGRAARIRKRTNHVTLVVENRIPMEPVEAGADSEE